MPTYEYECRKCGYRFEQFQRMTDEPLKRCPKCRCKVSRLLGTGAGIIFKGSGFYETDYRSKSYKEAVKKDKGQGDSTAGKKESIGSSSASSGEGGKNTTKKMEEVR